jgi:hypothetical protein
VNLVTSIRAFLLYIYPYCHITLGTDRHLLPDPNHTADTHPHGYHSLSSSSLDIIPPCAGLTASVFLRRAFSPQVRNSLLPPSLLAFFPSLFVERALRPVRIPSLLPWLTRPSQLHVPSPPSCFYSGEPAWVSATSFPRRPPARAPAPTQRSSKAMVCGQVWRPSTASRFLPVAKHLLPVSPRARPRGPWWRAPEPSPAVRLAASEAWPIVASPSPPSRSPLCWQARPAAPSPRWCSADPLSRPCCLPPYRRLLAITC